MTTSPAPTRHARFVRVTHWLTIAGVRSGHFKRELVDRLVLTDSFASFGDGRGQSVVNAGYAWYAGI